MGDEIYIKYSDYVKNIVSSNNLGNFKSNDSVTYMLEHVNGEWGKAYLDLIKSRTSIPDSEIIEYCRKNDSYGGGLKVNFGFITTSPSNFRYIFHAHLILTHMKENNMNNVNVVEIGGGYGGLCLAVNHLCNLYDIEISNYNLIDLPNVVKLQNMYLDKFKIDATLKFHNAYDYGKDITDKNLFLLSTYSFSEISAAHQAKYIQTLFPKAVHGFFAWNSIPPYDFGFPFRQETEYPFTQAPSRFVYF